ncbi:ABC-type sulfate transport system permease component [Vibrio variabilis]|uniref:ABC-type sulfate transport system permease component n=1 Tax=Vibrio variabilis TaxID=990271 RepID=A0ABQ0J6Y3_9VIBR|nr:ABC-type sulfate transport system permease component [Vibrio variabilis]
MKKQLLAMSLAVASTSVTAAIDITDNFSISGFGSTSWARSDNETPLLVNRNIRDEDCFDCDTTFGVQLDYFYEAFKASVQIVKRPQDHWSEPQLEWAYLGYSIGDFEVRAGRLRLPVFLASEYYYVGHAYTAARPNEEVYNSILGVTAYNGASVIWNYSLTDELQLSLTPFAGFKDTNEVELNPNIALEFETKNMWGVNAQLLGDNFRVNFAFLDSNFDQTTKLSNFEVPGTGGFVIPYSETLAPDQNIKLYSLGGEYDFGQLKLTAEGQKNDLGSSWYGSAAYRVQKFTPYVVYGQTYRDASEGNSYKGKTGDSWTLGLRYDVLYNVSINAEWQRFESFGIDDNGDTNSGPFIDSPGTDTDATCIPSW